jgi:hypothetical protein
MPPPDSMLGGYGCKRKRSVLLHPLIVGDDPFLWRGWNRRSPRRAWTQQLHQQYVTVPQGSGESATQWPRPHRFLEPRVPMLVSAEQTDGFGQRLHPVPTVVSFVHLGQACFSAWMLLARFPGGSSFAPILGFFCSRSAHVLLFRSREALQQPRCAIRGFHQPARSRSGPLLTGLAARCSLVQNEDDLEGDFPLNLFGLAQSASVARETLPFALAC